MNSTMSEMASKSVTPSDEGCIEDYNKEMLRQAELQSELTLRQSNVKKLTQDVHVLAEEVKRECLAEKWGSCPRSDGTQRARPEVQAAALCSEVAENPDILDDILMKLQYQKAKLQSEVAQVMSKLKDYD
ncbi:uncharacterized protein LOC119741012 [Patiria miniata]|uniref:Uncharacterized protein n=1 Tax=Patiria miniata TaxID=46514 RepID=A0A914B8M3_PATMI|nr:uncharacterized protein LOC119741012 [Patiria miniata]XP_038072500.1 uncharacterized protein LOC119741012 [Patiria miniata]XP_038072501.1 uncharacterized protein LOC119741012 [Patiria miniata]